MIDLYLSFCQNEIIFYKNENKLKICFDSQSIKIVYLHIQQKN